jgi:hypothetical protein
MFSRSISVCQLCSFSDNISQDYVDIPDLTAFIEYGEQKRPSAESIKLIDDTLYSIRSGPIKFVCMYHQCERKIAPIPLSKFSKFILIIYDGDHWVIVSDYRQFDCLSIFDPSHRGISKQLIAQIHKCLSTFGMNSYKICIEPIHQYSNLNDTEEAHLALGIALTTMLLFFNKSLGTKIFELDLEKLPSFFKSFNATTDVREIPRSANYSTLPLCTLIEYCVKLRCICKTPICLDNKDYYVCRKNVVSILVSLVIIP